MKIVVDEMPKYEWQCLFGKRDDDYGGYFCEFSRDVCNVDMCDYLKSITDYYGGGVFGEQFLLRER